MKKVLLGIGFFVLLLLVACATESDLAGEAFKVKAEQKVVQDANLNETNRTQVVEAPFNDSNGTGSSSSSSSSSGGSSSSSSSSSSGSSSSSSSSSSGSSSSSSSGGFNGSNNTNSS